jgi:hypothetical protein
MRGKEFWEKELRNLCRNRSIREEVAGACVQKGKKLIVTSRCDHKDGSPVRII